jgi:putative flippase GtrA
MPSLRGRLVAALGGRLATLRAPERFGMFLSVGVVGALCDNAVLVLLVELAGFAPLVAGLAAKEASITTMFLLNDRWTFNGEGASGHRARLRRFLTSNLVRAGGAGVGLATLYVLTEYAGIWYLAANVLGIGVGFVANYAGENLVTWRVHADASD